MHTDIIIAAYNPIGGALIACPSGWKDSKELSFDLLNALCWTSFDLAARYLAEELIRNPLPPGYVSIEICRYGSLVRTPFRN